MVEIKKSTYKVAVRGIVDKCTVSWNVEVEAVNIEDAAKQAIHEVARELEGSSTRRSIERKLRATKIEIAGGAA